jgi:GMP synthase PP-ATPase subunit
LASAARRSAGCPAASIPRCAAVLIHEAIGEQLTCVFVDHG